MGGTVVGARLCAVLLGAAAWGLMPGPVRAQSSFEDAIETDATPPSPPDPANDVSADDLDSLLEAADNDIEQLGQVDVRPSVAPMMDEEVTTVARQPSTVGKSPAAVFVITQEMIRRSAANTIPDVLRMVPGIEVARLDANKWAISARGFNNLYATKLLVQIDGRVVYNQFYSGVIWSHQDVVLQDVERIEVIRGPGATVWGANAVNGIINIITKSSADTQGLLAAGGTGTEERGFSTLRYGGQAGENFHWRIYGKQFERDGGYLFGDDFDDWRQARGGFRGDWTPTPDDVVTVQGDMFDGDTGEQATIAASSFPFATTATYDNHDAGQNCIVRWSHAVDEASDWSVQAYYDRWRRTSPFVDLEQKIADVDAQYRFPVGWRHNVICGASYRQIDDFFFGGFAVELLPPSDNTNLFSYFIQDQITLVEDEWHFIAGSKFVHNDFTGFEYQPSVRLLWTPSERETVWAAVSRAVRTPNRVDEGARYRQFQAFDAGLMLPVFSEFSGNPGTESEDLLAYEWGYRAQPTNDFSLDLALYYNDYTDLAEPLPPGAPFFDPTIPGLVVPLTLANALTADTYGAELAGVVQMSQDWLMTGAYTLMYLDVHSLTVTDTQEGSSPHNQIYVRSSWNLRPDLDFDLIGRYVDNLPALGVSSYFVMDVRLGWRPVENFEWAAVGRNLLDDRHAEFVDRLSGLTGTEVQSEMFTTLTWNY